ITYSLGLTIDGKYIESQGNSDFLIQQIDSKGTIVWQKKYASKYRDALNSLSVTKENNLLISGKYANISEFRLKSSIDSTEDERTYFSSVYPDGSLSWSVNNSGPSFPNGTMLFESRNSEYISADVFSSVFFADRHRLVPAGNWFNSYLALHDRKGNITQMKLQVTGIISTVIQTADNSLVVAGSCSAESGISGKINPSGGFIDFFLGKLKSGQETSAIPVDTIPEINYEYTLFPNPVENTICTLDSKNVSTVDRVNITGQEGRLLQYDNNCRMPYQLNLAYLSQGTYFVAIIKDGRITTKKLVLK
ncbi:MAG: T9SS type A sorting domain-containing protein, partial [Bacteroidota bacterium]